MARQIAISGRVRHMHLIDRLSKAQRVVVVVAPDLRWQLRADISSASEAGSDSGIAGTRP